MKNGVEHVGTGDKNYFFAKIIEVMITYSLNKNLGDTVLANLDTPRKDVEEFSPPAHLSGRLSKFKLNLLHKNGNSYKCLEKSLSS